MTQVTLIVFVAAIVLNASANILIKASAYQSGSMEADAFIKQLFNPWLIAGLTSFGLAFLAYRHVLSQNVPLSIAYPIMTSTGFIIVLMASRIFFHENLDWIQYAGIAMMIVGLWLVASRMAPTN
ncbi:MAG: cation transporter [Leptospiraceae bacterium]|nr:cation transporter [Leptospiraceae bacterium]